MSGYVVADSEALVMQKVGTNVQYKVTEDAFVGTHIREFATTA